MELLEALGRISEIRARIADTETFRGFRSLTVGFSGLLGIATVFIQRHAMAHSTFTAGDFINLWVAVALVSLAVVTNVIPYIVALSALPLMMQTAGVEQGKYRLNVAVAVVAMLYSTYAIYASGKDAVLGGMIVTAIGFVIWGFIAHRFVQKPALATA